MNTAAPEHRGPQSVITRLLAVQGPVSILRMIGSYAAYHLRDKWNFVYFEFSLNRHFVTFPQPEGLQVRIAASGDIDRLEADVFGRLKSSEIYDRRYLPLIGNSKVRCFLGERAGKIVHYSWVFLDASSSPLAEVPFEASRIKPGDAYVGPVYTVPGDRGFVYPSVLSTIVGHLQENLGSTRILVLVAGDNEPAVSFYKKMGFHEIRGAARRGGVQGFLRRLRRAICF